MTVSTPIPKDLWLKNLLHIPKDQGLVWWMIEKQNNRKAQLLGLIGFIVIFWIAFESPWAALAMILGMYLHELGHYLVFVANRIKAVVLILFPLGAVAAPSDKAEDERSDQLSWWNISWLLQAGPTMNVLLMMIGVVLVHTNTLPLLGQQMVFINGVLALFNLLPLLNMDGGQLFKVIFSSLKENYDTTVAVIATFVSMLIVGAILITPIVHGAIHVLLAILKNLGLFTFLILMVAGIWHKQGRDNPKDSSSPQAMTLTQVSIQILYYIALVVLTLLLFTL